ncbi:MAG: DUF87 domain-containing protein, partial [Thiomargarita sp.]|nr:DUF87 domain-containing protein [Thiomargarita sp.]
VITALKSLTGNYVLQLFQEDNQETQKIIAMGITLHHLIKNKRLQGAFLMPIRVHPEVFGDTQEICDFLLIKFDKTNIRIMCIDSILDTVISDDVKNRLDNTTEILCDRYFIAKEQQMLGTPLERSRIVILMRYYFTKAVRYGFITKNDDIAKYNDIFNKIEAGKIQPSAIAKTVYLVSTTQTVASSKPIKDNGMTIITLGSGVLTGEADQNVVMEEEFTYDIPQTSDVKPDSPKIPDIATVHPKTSHKVPEIIIGKTAGMGQDVIWKPSVEGSPHVMIVGIPGQGKSVTLNTLLCRLQENGVGVLALDFHNDFGDAKHSSFARLYHPTIWNAAQGLPFSPLEADLQDEMGQNSWKNQSANLADIFEYVCTLGTQQRYGLLCAITKCYEDVIRRGDNVLPTISELSRKVQRLEKNKEIQNGVMARCHPILDMNVFKPQSEPWDILETTQSGLVINLKDIGSDTVRQATSAFILRKVYQDILTWEKTDVMKLVIVLDEAHRLTKDKT